MQPPLTRKSSILFFTLVLLLLSPACSHAQSLTCTRVVDGDTIVLSNGEKVRLIGVDTPETVRPNTPVEYYGKEASAFTKQMIEGKTVRLEYDWQERDKYGRLLAYVYLMDGTFNLLLDHALGKPPEQIHQEQVVFIMSRKNADAQDADVIDAEQKSLPEGEEE